MNRKEIFRPAGTFARHVLTGFAVRGTLFAQLVQAGKI